MSEPHDPFIFFRPDQWISLAQGLISEKNQFLMKRHTERVCAIKSRVYNLCPWFWPHRFHNTTATFIGTHDLFSFIWISEFTYNTRTHTYAVKACTRMQQIQETRGKELQAAAESEVVYLVRDVASVSVKLAFTRSKRAGETTRCSCLCYRTAWTG